MKANSKYQPLFEYLRKCDHHEIVLTFADIENLIKTSLPNSAKNKKAWWSNRSKNALQSMAWMDAGYRAEIVDFETQSVTFRQSIPKNPIQRQGDTVLWNGELIKALRLHMKLTQTEFAEKLGVYQQTVSQWEKGAYSPTLATSKHLTLVAEQAGFQHIDRE